MSKFKPLENQVCATRKLVWSKVSSKQRWAKYALQMQLRHNNNNNYLFSLKCILNISCSHQPVDINKVTLLVIIQVTWFIAPTCIHRVLWKVFLSYFWESLNVLIAKLALAIFCILWLIYYRWFSNGHHLFHCLSAVFLLTTMDASTILPGFLLRQWASTMPKVFATQWQSVGRRMFLSPWMVYCKGGFAVALIWNSSSMGLYCSIWQADRNLMEAGPGFKSE